MTRYRHAFAAAGAAAGDWSQLTNRCLDDLGRTQWRRHARPALRDGRAGGRPAQHPYVPARFDGRAPLGRCRRRRRLRHRHRSVWRPGAQRTDRRPAGRRLPHFAHRRRRRGRHGRRHRRLAGGTGDTLRHRPRRPGQRQGRVHRAGAGPGHRLLFSLAGSRVAGPTAAVRSPMGSPAAASRACCSPRTSPWPRA